MFSLELNGGSIADPVDMVVSVAIGFQDEDFTRPLLQKCQDYKGTSDNVLISVTCFGSDSSEGLEGYGVFVKFYGEVNSSSSAICQMEIFLRDSR